MMRKDLDKSFNSSLGNNFEKRILKLLGSDLMSTSEVAKRLGMRRDVAAGYLEALKDQGKLEFHKVGRSHVYMLSERLRK